MAPPVMTFAEPMPKLWWDSAYHKGNEFVFNMETFMCDEAFANYETMLIVTSTGWCPNCPSYIKYVASKAEELEANGAAVMFLVGQDVNYEPSASEFANAYITNYIGPDFGYRMGKLDMMPSMAAYDDSPPDGIYGGMFDAIPRSIMVRKRDMRIIASQHRMEYMLPFVKVAANPEFNWIDPTFVNNCGPGDEEYSEPNDSAEEKAVIWEGDNRGGICNEQVDFFEIQRPGPWKLVLEFDSSVGDLDLYIWNETYNAPKVGTDGQVLASSGSGNTEEIVFHDLATILVTGSGLFSAPYNLKVIWPYEEE
jgi:hypothetical protein